MKKIDIVSGVYLIKYTPTGDFYIGSSFNIHHRFEQHMMERSKWFNSDKAYYELYLLEYSTIDTLKDREQHYIDSLKPTLNINKSATRPPRKCGEDNNKASYDASTYAMIFLTLAAGVSVADTAKALNVTKEVVKRIYSLKSHTYLHTKFPHEHTALIKLRKERNKTLPIKIWHKEHGEHTLCRPFSEFCTRFGIPNNGNISRLYNGSRKSYLGWKVVGD